MLFPYVIVEGLNEELKKKWKDYYSDLKDKYTNRDRKVDEGIWRRTQMFGTRHESNWKTHNDMRRRMLHYSHNYDIVKNGDVYNLCMVGSYVWIHLTFPKEEIEQYLNDIIRGLKIGEWELVREEKSYYEYKKNDLYYCIWLKDAESEDMCMNRIFPVDYKCLEIQVCTENRRNNFAEKKKTWGVLNNGPRIRDINGKYVELADIRELKKYLPAHIELGCGPSIELGIPPLNFLHDIYYVTDKETHKFILGPQKDKLAYEIAAHTEKMYELFSIMYKKCFLAVPNSEFYICLKKNV